MSDLIRREDVDKAIRSICDLCGEDKKNNGVMCGACNLDSFIREFDGIPSAEPERIIKIGQRSGKTLESAIDYLQSTGWLQEHDRILTESAEPERKWIPVTERLPKPWQEVLTTYEYRARQYVQTAEYTGDTDDNGHPLFCSYTDEYAPDHYDFIYVAWMPLPEPWRGEQ